MVHINLDEELFIPFVREWGMSLEVKSPLAMFSILLLLFCSIVSVLSGPAISLTQCKSGDDACVTNAVKAAYPLILEKNAEIGAEEMDPLYEELIEGNLSILKFKLFNTTTTGYKSCEIKKAKYDEEAEHLQIEFLCPHFKLQGVYEVDGRLIILPVQGNGIYVLDAKQYAMNLDLELKTITKDGKSYKTIKSFKVKAEPLESVSFDFQNLFNGQKELADPVIQFANEHWKEVAHEIQDPAFITNLKKIVKNANKYLKTLAIEEYTAA